jgi:Uncharacterized protein involved in methicillin resistance
MQAQIITDRQQWDDFVAASDLCNITQTYEWGELMSQKHAEFLPIGVVQDDGSLCAAMLILISAVPGLHVPYFYAPRGPIIANPSSPAMTILLNFVRAEARKRGICMLKVEPGVADEDAQWSKALRHYGFRTIPYAHHLRHEWVTDIRADADALLAAMHKKTRQYIRTAGRTDVVIRLGQGQADIDAFYNLYCQTGDRSEFMVLDKAYYERFLSLYKDKATLLVAERDGRVIAAAIVAYLGVWGWNMYEAASEESRELRINYLLQWKRILWAKEHGCWYFNSRGIPDVLEEGQELYGVYNFKRGFGGYAMRSLVTHDLVYRPLIYKLYRTMLDAKHWYEQRQAAKRADAERQAAEQKRQERAQAQKAGTLESTIPNAAAIQTLRKEATNSAEVVPDQQSTTRKKAPRKQTKTAQKLPQIPETPRPQTEPTIPSPVAMPVIPETPRPQLEHSDHSDGRKKRNKRKVEAEAGVEQVTDKTVQE